MSPVSRFHSYRLVLDEEPSLIKKEKLERGKAFRIGDFKRGPMQDIEEQRLQNVRRVTPSAEVEGLEAGERQRVFAVIEEKAVLPIGCPAMQPFLQLADDLGESRERPLRGLDDVHILDGCPQFPFLFEVEVIPLAGAFDQDTEE
jgi:hypothetical protein